MVDLAQSKVDTLEEQNHDLQVKLMELQTQIDTMTNQSLCTTSNSTSSCSSTDNNHSAKDSYITTPRRERSSPTSSFDAVVPVVEYTNDGEDEMISTSIIETKVPNSQQSQQRQHTPRTAIDHGRLLLQRLDSPAATTTATHNNPSYTK